MADLNEPTARPSMKGTGKGRAGPKRRVRNTCKACRERKVQCSRGDPCELCARKGWQCDWSNAQPAFQPRERTATNTRAALESNRKTNDAEAILKTVSRVLKLVETLEDSDKGPLGYRRHQDLRGVPLEHTDNDLATQLSNMTLSQSVPDHREQGVHRPQAGSGAVVNEVSRLLASQAPDQMFPADGILGLGAGPQSIRELARVIPRRDQAIALFAQYVRYVAWMHRIIHDPTFWIEMDRFYQRRSDSPSTASEDKSLVGELHWLAGLFGVCGLAMYTNDFSREQAMALRLPIAKDQQMALGRSWVQCAGSALVLGEFMERPSVAAIKAMIIMAQLPLYISNGENLGAVMSFVTLGLNLAAHVKLDVDPDELEEFKDSSDLVKQDRRRIMNALLGADWKMQSLLCKKWGLQHPSKYNVQLPLDVFDEDFDITTGALMRPPRAGCQQTIFTGLNARIQVSRKWMELGIALSDVDHPPTHARILAFDEQLEALEAGFPPCIRTKFLHDQNTLEPAPSVGNPLLAIDRLGTYAALAGAHLRLHRGFLSPMDGVPVEDVSLHRKRVLYYGRMLLAIERSGFYPLNCVPLQYFVLSAAIALCVYTMTANDDDRYCDQVRSEVHAICSLISPIVATSSILRRSHLTLRFLLSQDTLRAEELKRSRAAKRMRTAEPVYTPETGRRLSSTLANASASFDSLRSRGTTATKGTPQIEDEDEELPHRSVSASASLTPPIPENEAAPRQFVDLPRHPNAPPVDTSAFTSSSNADNLPGLFMFDWSVPVPEITVSAAGASRVVPAPVESPETTSRSAAAVLSSTHPDDATADQAPPMVMGWGGQAWSAAMQKDAASSAAGMRRAAGDPTLAAAASQPLSMQTNVSNGSRTQPPRSAPSPGDPDDWSLWLGNWFQ